MRSGWAVGIIGMWNQQPRSVHRWDMFKRKEKNGSLKTGIESLLTSMKKTLCVRTQSSMCLSEMCIRHEVGS